MKPFNLHFQLLTGLFMAASLCLAATTPQADWKKLALRLTGESDSVRNQSIRQLKAIENLDRLLREAFSTKDRYLALDVLIALDRNEFVDALINSSLDDDNGAVYLTLNALMQKEDQKKVAHIYRRRLRETPAAPYKYSLAAQLIMVDTIGRLGALLGKEEVLALFQSPHYEIRDAAVYYLRNLTFRYQRYEYVPLFEKALQVTPYQVRLRALHTLPSLPSPLWHRVYRYFEQCTGESQYLRKKPVPKASRETQSMKWLANCFLLFLVLGCEQQSKPVATAIKPPPVPVPSELDWYPPAKENALTAWNIPQAAREKSACYQTYQKFYEPKELHFYVLFGYKDTRPALYVGDRYERASLLQYLIRPCPKGIYACGFSRDPDDMDLLTKTISGPDGAPRKIVLHWVGSSVGPNDERNRQDLYQRWQSFYAELKFMEGTAKGDLVIYNGHSRDGGGPDFAPPLIWGKHVAYPWYVKNKPGLRKLIFGLKRTADKPKVLGLFSCVSTSLFAQELRLRHPRMALVTSRTLIYYTEAARNLLGTLSAVLGMWCEPDFRLAIQADSKRYRSKLEGFFKSSRD